MDNLNDAFSTLGMNIENLDETAEKIIRETDNEIGVNVSTPRESKSDILIHSLTNADRDQAVYEQLVPKTYRDAYFNRDKIKENIKAQYQKSKLYKVYRFDEYATTCESILSLIRMKMLPDKSYIIGAPNGFGKTSFVNEAIITLRKQGYKVAPYISLWELAQIRVDNEHRIMQPYSRFKKEGENVIYTEASDVSKYYKKPSVITGAYSYSEYINADCLFVSLTDVISKDIESHTLYQLLSIRGAKGLPTIVMMSTSLVPYENDTNLKELVWDEIKNYNENNKCYDRVYHVSCYKRKEFSLNNKDERVDTDTGIVMQD